MRFRIALIASMLLLQPLAGFANPSLTDTATQFFGSLTKDQKTQALLPYDNPERTAQVYTGGPRAGIQLKNLTPDQQKLAIDLLTQFLSPYGKQKAQEIADQPSNTKDPTTGMARYYVCFFGEPGAGKTYAWRIAEHHLTIVHVEVEAGEPTSFGPILLGANPPDLWDAEEEKLLALHAAMTDAERDKCSNQGKANAADPLKPRAKKIRVAELTPSSKQAAQAVLDHRLSFFADDIQKRIRAALDKSGGFDDLTVSFYGTVGKKCREGGLWDFKLANEKFLCDYEGSRAHIHFSLKTS